MWKTIAVTTDLMTNHEVLEVNQDVLGRGGSRVFQQDRLDVWARPLADGTKAVALFNAGCRLQRSPHNGRISLSPAVRQSATSGNSATAELSPIGSRSACRRTAPCW
jgi:Alpha galactosidase C-terminal beta sandwich domain